jgi:hypothetical protein
MDEDMLGILRVFANRIRNEISGATNEPDTSLERASDEELSIVWDYLDDILTARERRKQQ